MPISGSSPNNFLLEVSRGNIAGMTSVNRFGRTTNADTGINTDVWNRANVADNQAIWIAPTQARIHDIVSTSASDDGSPAGVGGRTLRVFGLTDWDTAETFEDIILNGTTNVPTVSSYVIVNRLKMLTWGATSTNVGTITATAQTDATVTAQIEPSHGQTEMAIYGFPSVQTAFTTSISLTVNKGSSGGINREIDGELLFNPIPDQELTNFLVVGHAGRESSGTASESVPIEPPGILQGPGIIKVQITSDTNNVDAAATFNLVLIDN